MRVYTFAYRSRHVTKLIREWSLGLSAMIKERNTYRFKAVSQSPNAYDAQIRDLVLHTRGIPSNETKYRVLGEPYIWVLSNFCTLWLALSPLYILASTYVAASGLTQLSHMVPYCEPILTRRNPRRNGNVFPLAYKTVVTFGGTRRLMPANFKEVRKYVRRLSDVYLGENTSPTVAL